GTGGSRAAVSATSGVLLIADGAKPLTFELTRQHILTGSFTYVRHTGRVDVTLVLSQGGKEVREATLFAGPEPPAPVPPVAPANEALAAENQRLREDFARQVERNKTLEKALGEMRKMIQRDEQRKRLEHQSRDAVK